MTSRPAPALNADGTWSTLGQLLSTLMPSVDLKAQSKHPGCDEGEAPPLIAAQSASDHASAAPSADLVPKFEAPLANHIMFDPLMSCPPEVTAVAGPTDPHAQTAGGPTDPHAQTTGEREDSGNRNGAAPSDQQPGPAHTPPGPFMTNPLSGLRCGGVFQALVSGIAPPLETPIAWLHAQMHAPDYFLYIVVMPVR